MVRILAKYFEQLRIWGYRRRIQRALALNIRGEARPDGLRVVKARNRLEINWRARQIHPWDRDVAVERESLMFFEQSLADTEAAISRLFEALPEVEVIDLTVTDPASEATIIVGTVHRSKLERTRQLLSVKMRLRELGVNYRLTGSRLESLDSAY